MKICLNAEAFLKHVNSESIETAVLIKKLQEILVVKSDDLACLTACGRQKKFDNRVIYVRTKLIREQKIGMDKNKRIWLR